ncbi:hypothetical protein SARC_01807 [Sphaeroforma arctica JP610]|uniref:Protein-tyrosine phosphatase n=1 Tax=Sphaeroforma arctica JP610 TaxID=667725 RepID=A0A0L0GAT1_9EUKA|nr:hypothetical protein SARC_01807 [Sphaeroforma arctica JP610]KNC86006.1 hypothetical protein SARC_01807 [Sphaeroforma arctica JP610]|eukprot:XP_014159908.1 hypothetical protein SARC_01807 [Sphaeroforma arctica JP610]
MWICEQEQLLSTDQTSAKDPQNKDKNRYSNILPLEHSRVKLENAKNDYINANYIHGYNKKNQFIAAQGPLANTANDFWEMVWEQNSISVVMTTKLIENGRLKCDQYWPNVENSKQYDDIRVETIDEIDSDCGSFLERTMTLTKKACKPNAKESPKRPCALPSPPKPNSMQKADTTPRDCKTKSPSNTSQATSPKVKVFHENSLTTSPTVKAFRDRAVTKSVSEESLERSSDEMPVDDEQEETRTIVQYYYKAWPDHGVPSSPNGVIEMLGAINERQEAQAGAGPIVVHCSAGVGRTGTMVAIDTAIKAVLDPKNGFVDFPRVILDLRRQRQMMVQSLSQYAFCYYALDEFVEKDMPDNDDGREDNSA